MSVIPLHEDMVRMVEAGDDPDVIKAAFTHRYRDVFLPKPADFRALLLCHAVWYSHESLVLSLLEEDPQVNYHAQHTSFPKPLVLAVANKNVKMIEVLLGRGASVNSISPTTPTTITNAGARSSSTSHYSAVECALSKDSLDLVIMMEKSFEEEPNDKECTLLHLATKYNARRCVQHFLRTKDATYVNALDKKRYTALMEAVVHGAGLVTDFLLAGAHAGRLSDTSLTPIHVVFMLAERQRRPLGTDDLELVVKLLGAAPGAVVGQDGERSVLSYLCKLAKTVAFHSNVERHEINRRQTEHAQVSLQLAKRLLSSGAGVGVGSDLSPLGVLMAEVSKILSAPSVQRGSHQYDVDDVVQRTCAGLRLMADLIGLLVEAGADPNHVAHSSREASSLGLLLTLLRSNMVGFRYLTMKDPDLVNQQLMVVMDIMATLVGAGAVVPPDADGAVAVLLAAETDFLPVVQLCLRGTRPGVARDVLRRAAENLGASHSAASQQRRAALLAASVPTLKALARLTVHAALPPGGPTRGRTLPLPTPLREYVNDWSRE